MNTQKRHKDSHRMTVALSPTVYAKILKESYKQSRKNKKRVSMHDILVQIIDKGLEK